MDTKQLFAQTNIVDVVPLLYREQMLVQKAQKVPPAVFSGKNFVSLHLLGFQGEL